MRILKYHSKLVEEVAYANGTVVFLKYVKEEDKDRCECGKTIDKEIALVQDSREWESSIIGVHTLK